MKSEADTIPHHSDPSNPRQSLSAKRPYAKPLFVDYGDISVLTNNVGNMGNPDGGAMNTMSSQP